MVVNYLTGNESPTAAKMNQLWSEADAVLNKALNGCSTYLLSHIGASASPSSYPLSYLYKGKEFIWYPGVTHGTTSTTPIYAAFETIPNTYDQSTYDTAAANATISSYSSDGYAHVAGSSTPNLSRSMKAHTRTNSGQEYYIWEYDQPAPEKKWKFAVAEMIIAEGSGTQFSIPDEYNKYNCFRVHNLTNRDYTIYCGSISDPHKTFTLPAYNQISVRRVGTTFYHDYNYFFKCLPNDPRFLFFDSFDGSIAQTMRANNITNPNYLYNVFEYVGMDNNPFLSTAGHHQRIFFNSATQNDIGSEYHTSGHFPEITDSTKIADLVYHKGKIGYRKKDTSSSTLETGTIDFDGWGSFKAELNTIDANIEPSAISNNDDTNLATNATPSLLELWPLSTNVLQINDVNAVLNLASTAYKLQTHFLKVPDIHQYSTTIGVDLALRPKSFRGYHALWNEIASSGANPDKVGTGYDGTVKDVAYLKTQVEGYCSLSNPEEKHVKLTSEGPKLVWRDVFGIHSPLNGGDNAAYWGGAMTNHSFTLSLDSGTLKLKCDQEWLIPKRLHIAGYSGSSVRGKASVLYAYNCGWPSQWKDSFFNAVTTNYRHHIDTHKFHRIHETPRQARKYETATPITAGTETFKHNDFNNDPVGLNGADITLNNIGTLTESSVKFLTNDIDAKISKGSFAGGEVNNPNYPRLVVDDVILEVENSKTATSLNTIKTPASYNRVNLLKEHYNNFAVLVKKADKIRPLSIDEVYFGNRIMKPGTGWFNGSVAPIDLYEGFVDGDSQDDLYTDLLGASKVYDYTDFADGAAIRNAASTNVASNASQHERDDVDDFRYVKISDVKAFADAEGLGFRFEEVAAPCSWVASLVQDNPYLGNTISVTNAFLLNTSGTANYKAYISSGGFIAGANYGRSLNYIPIESVENDLDETTLGQTFYMQPTSDKYNLNAMGKSNGNATHSGTTYGVKSSFFGYVLGLVVQIVDGTNGRTNNPRANLGLKPMKTVIMSGTNFSAGADIDIDDSRRVETAVTELENITTYIHYYYPTKPRHRYTYLCQINAAKTHSA